MPEIPDTEPSRIIAGDTARWLKRLSCYPASDGWALGYQFTNAAAQFEVAAAADGDAYLVNVPAASTAAWESGDYSWRARVTKGGDVFTVGEGHATVVGAYSAPTEGRGPARQALDAVQAYLRNPNNLQAASYTIAGRTLSRYSLAELWKHRDRLALEVQKEDAAAGVAGSLQPRGRVLVRFGK